MLWLLAVAYATPPDQTAVAFPAEDLLHEVTTFDLDGDCVLVGHAVADMYLHGGPISKHTPEGWVAAGRWTGALQDLRVVGEQTAYLLWEWQIEGVHPGMHRTTDGGRTWEEVPLDEAARRTGECCFQEADALRANGDAVAVELAGYGWIASTDGGQTWVDGRNGVGGCTGRPRARTCRVEDDGQALTVSRRGPDGWAVQAVVPKTPAP